MKEDANPKYCMEWGEEASENSKKFKIVYPTSMYEMVSLWQSIGNILFNQQMPQQKINQVYKSIQKNMADEFQNVILYEC